MIAYVQVEDDKIVTQAVSKDDLPKTWRYPDDSSVSGFNLLNDKDLAKAGWLKVDVVDEPKFDSKTHQLANERVELRKGVPVRTWDVQKNVFPLPSEPKPDPKPTLDERLASLETEVKELKARK